MSPRTNASEVEFLNLGGLCQFNESLTEEESIYLLGSCVILNMLIVSFIQNYLRINLLLILYSKLRMDASKLLRRVSEVDKLRAAGLTDDEIKELKGMECDREAQFEERANEIAKVEEFVRLKNLEDEGLIDEDDQKKLDKQAGVFYTFNFRGSIFRVNHCVVARAIIGGTVMLSSLAIIYLCTFKPIKIAQPNDFNQ